MSGFHDILLPLKFGLGAQASLERRTEIASLGGGRESRNALWAQARRRFDIGPAIRTPNEAALLTAFFEARLGRLFAFRFRDFTDFDSAPPGAAPTPFDQGLTADPADPQHFPLRKHYGDGANGVWRAIELPVADSVRLALNGRELVRGPDFAVEGNAVRLAAPPAAGAVITAGFRFDVRVRFEADRLDFIVEAPNALRVPAIGLIETFN